MLALCREAIAGNAKAVGQYKDGNEKALNALKGPVMKATKGKANPAMLDELLKKLIDLIQDNSMEPDNLANAMNFQGQLLWFGPKPVAPKHERGKPKPIQPLINPTHRRLRERVREYLRDHVPPVGD